MLRPMMFLNKIKKNIKIIRKKKERNLNCSFSINKTTNSGDKRMEDNELNKEIEEFVNKVIRFGENDGIRNRLEEIKVELVIEGSVFLAVGVGDEE
jgi:hypothetical protein